jgi:hypothetical protein
MISRHSLRRLLTELRQRKSDIDSLICFFEKYGKQAACRRSRAKTQSAGRVGNWRRQNS